jgi:hypothetical protein
MDQLLAVLWAIPDFVLAVVSSLAGYITGGVLMALSWIWEHKNQKNLPWRICRWGLAGFLLASFFSVWYSERPGLIAVLNGVYRGQEVVSGQIIPTALLLVEVRNSGAPSIATAWKMDVTVNGKAIQGRSMAITKPVVLNVPGNPTRTYLPSNYLADKTVKQPIPQGGLVAGMLLIHFTSLNVTDLKAVPDSDIHVTFEDVKGRKYKAINKAHDRGIDLTYPGLDISNN